MSKNPTPSLNEESYELGGRFTITVLSNAGDVVDLAADRGNDADGRSEVEASALNANDQCVIRLLFTTQIAHRTN